MENRSDFNDNKHHHNSGTSKVAVGVVLIFLGFMLVMRNIGLLPSYFHDIVFSWQMLLIAIGFVMTLGTGNRGPGLIVMAVGGFFILPDIFDANWNSFSLFWPAIFIIVGVIVLTNARWLKSENWRSKSTNASDNIDVVSIFGGGERIINSQNFSGGKITAIFGGSEIDLTRAQLSPGESVIELSCIFGGASLIVPPDWNVVIDITPILGGFSDSRKIIHGGTVDYSKTLILRGAVVFGGGEIKSY
jgi:predicted membrane protein